MQLKCADFVPIPDIEVFRVPGEGPSGSDLRLRVLRGQRPERARRVPGRRPERQDRQPEPGRAGLPPRSTRARADAVSRPDPTPSVADRTIRVTGGDLLVFFIVHGGTLAELPGGEPGATTSARLPVAFFSLTRLNPDPGTLYGGDHLIGFQQRVVRAHRVRLRGSQPVQRLGLRRRRLHRLGAPRAARLRRPGQRRRRHRRRLRQLPVGRRIPISATATAISSVTPATIAWTSRTSHRATRTATAAATPAASRSVATGATTTETGSSMRTIPAVRRSTSRSSPSRPAARGSAPRSGYEGRGFGDVRGTLELGPAGRVRGGVA